MAKIDYEITHLKGARIISCGRDANAVLHTYKHAMRGISRALEFFGLKREFPLINIFIAPGRKEYDKLVSHLTRTPTGKGRLGQPQGHDLYLISPNAWHSDVHPDYLGSGGAFDKTIYRQFIEHETVHMVEEYISPKGAMEVRPQWWSEGLAVYLTGQYKDKITGKDLKEDLAAGRLPRIAELKGRDAYVWGWALVRHLEKRCGKKKLAQILLRSCTGDIPAFLKISKKELDRTWLRAQPRLAQEALRRRRKE